MAGHLDVEPADLVQVAGQYSALQTAAATLGPHAVDEVNRIIASHGAMGFPVAVGVVAGLARRQAALDAKVADFGRYAERFIEHAAAYRDADHQGAQRYAAIDFSEAAAPPVAAGDTPSDPYPKLVCWIGTADGDTSVCSKEATEYLYVEDGVWKNRQVDNGYVAGLPPSAAAPRTTLLPAPPEPGADPFTEAAPRDRTVYWPEPDGSMGQAWRQPDGSVISSRGDSGAGVKISPIMPGDLPMWGQEPI